MITYNTSVMSKPAVALLCVSFSVKHRSYTHCHHSSSDDDREATDSEAGRLNPLALQDGGGVIND